MRFHWFLMRVMTGVAALGLLSACTSSFDSADQNPPPFPQELQTSGESLDPAVYAQNVLKNPELRFEQIGLQQGLSNSTVTAGIQDSKGILWFATADGLNKYDGYQFNVFRYDPQNPASISDNAIRDLAIAPDGALWVASEYGLNRMDPITETFTRYFSNTTQEDTISSNTVNALLFDSHGELWVGTEGGLNRYDAAGGAFERFIYLVNGRATYLNNAIHSLFEDQNGLIWVGTSSGLRMFDPELKSYRELPQQLARFFLWNEHSVYNIVPGREGRVWVGTSNGLFAYSQADSAGAWYLPREMDSRSLTDKNVRTVFEDQSGLVWVGTQNGLNLYRPDQDNFYQFKKSAFYPSGLGDNTINHIFQDRSGVIWFLTASGINSLDISIKQFLNYHNLPDEDDSLINNQVFAIREDQRGYLWIGTIQGLDRLDRRTNHYRHFKHDSNNLEGLSDEFITAIFEDSSNNLWIGTDGGGLNLYDPIYETFRHYRARAAEPNSISNDSVSVIMEDSQGFLWIATANGMLNRLDSLTGEFSNLQLDAGDAASQSRMRIRSMIQDSLGILWIGSNYGLYALDPESGEILHFRNDIQNEDSLSDDLVMSVHEDQTGRIWVGTFGGGLNLFDRENGAFRKFTQRDGLPNDIVYGILEDEEQNLWLSTNHGLSKFSLTHQTFENFDVDDGLQSNEFNEKAYFKSASGEMFFGGVNGVTAFYPQNVKDNPYQAPVVLSSFTVGGQPVAVDRAIEYLDTVELTWPQNYFEFSFSGLSYQQPGENQYAYFLRGFDKEWNISNELRFGRYTNLPGGEYELVLVAANEDGLWNLEGSTVKITIVPPLWERPVFQWMLVALLGVLIGSGYYLKVRSVQTRNLELSSLVELRTAEIEQKRQVAEGLKDVLVLLNSNQSLQESLNFIVRAAHRLADAEHVLLLGIKDDPVTCVTVRGSQKREDTGGEAANAGEDMPELINWLAGLAKTGEVYKISRLEEFLKNRGEEGLLERYPYRSMLMLPILSGTDLFGSFVMMYAGEERFGAEQVELASSFADQAALAIGNANLRERAEQMAVVAERNRLARDLHDAVTQTLFSASLIAEALPALLENDPEEGKAMLKEIRQLSRGALAEMRTLLIELRPSAVVETSLSELVRQLAEAAGGRNRMRVNFSSKLACKLPEDVHVSFYRIAQEALNNVVKHAHAKQVEILLESHTIKDGYNTVGMEIRDDGVGFNLAEKRTDHFGLGIMYERANLIQAELSIESEQSKGTWINVEWQGRAE